MRGLFFLLFVFCVGTAYAQYPPQAGVTGSTAIHKTDAAIKGWANACTIRRGYMDIAQPGLGPVTSGSSTLALGPADNYIVSLGDSGVATLSFAGYISNGPGADFAIFENGFADPNNPEEAFLELAFVEVSSDGINYTRFPAASLTDTPQVPVAGVYMNARNLNNLAGKYISNYGTPFDLQELSGIAGLDIDHITHVRLVDVVGTLGAQASYDDNGRKINDPYPTPIPTGGFDLDAVAVINGDVLPAGVATPGVLRVSVYPNPTADKVVVICKQSAPLNWQLTDTRGRILQAGETTSGQSEISMAPCTAGIYYLVLRDTNGKQWVEKITRL